MRGIRGAGLAAALMAPVCVAAQTPGAGADAARPPRIVETTLTLADGWVLPYAISLPTGYDDDDARPLVLALHPGGRAPYYGGSFMRSIVEPGLRSWGAIIVAPDVPDRSWATPRSEQAILALVEHVFGEHAVDPERVLVTGFSMGGRGTWYTAARHPEVFTGAVVMAGSPGEDEIGRLTDMPIYLIHSPDDEVVPFEPVERAYRALAERSHPVELRVLPGAGHYMMGAYLPALRLAGEWMLARWQDAGR